MRVDALAQGLQWELASQSEPRSVQGTTMSELGDSDAKRGMAAAWVEETQGDERRNRRIRGGTQQAATAHRPCRHWRSHRVY